MSWIVDNALWVTIALFTAVGMEGWAALMHGRLWHGVLLPLHRSHHQRRSGWFEANDLLAVSHAPISMALIVYGLAGPPGLVPSVCLGVGVGMAVFGAAYALVHDGYIHQRLPVGFLGRLPGIQAIRRAHLRHHGRGDVPFGLFLGPWEERRAGRR